MQYAGYRPRVISVEDLYETFFLIVNEYLAGIKADGILEKMEKKWVDGPEEVREFYDPTEPPDVNGKITVITQSGRSSKKQTPKGVCRMKS